MLRRSFLATVLAAVFTKPRIFTFRIKTKKGTTVSGVSISATDEENAKYLLRKRYPGCEILEMKER